MRNLYNKITARNIHVYNMYSEVGFKYVPLRML